MEEVILNCDFNNTFGGSQWRTYVRIAHPVRTSWPGRRWPNTLRAETQRSRSPCGSGTGRCCPDRMWPAPAEQSGVHAQWSAVLGSKLYIIEAF